MARLGSLLLALLLWAAVTAAEEKTLGLEEDAYRDAYGLITTKGYPFEAHSVTTDDGYLLTLHRIPHFRGQEPKEGRPVVFLQHGILDSSDGWLVNTEDNGIPFWFSRHGFDVWLGNSRGNKYSRSHVRMLPSQTSFWQWSFDDMAYYDLPAALKHVTEITGQAKVIYMGHSQGSTQMFAALTYNPEVASRVSLFIALSPVVFLSHQTSTLLSVLSKAKIDSILVSLGLDEFLPGPTLRKALGPVCSVATVLCEAGLYLISDAEPEYSNRTRLPVFMEHFPSGTSVMDMQHYIQYMHADAFKRFDFGSPDKNKMHYHVPEPPAYDLSSITTPTVFLVGKEDRLADPQDYQLLKQRFPASALVHSEEFEHYGHMTFMWAQDNLYFFHSLFDVLDQHARPALLRAKQLQQEQQRLRRRTSWI